MRALRIKAFQETACYTRPFANKVTETYPLPPFSTVKGLLHAVMGAEQLVPFHLSIQGDYETLVIDYRKTYFVKKNTVNMPIIFDGLAIDTPTFPDMTSMPLYTHMLYNVELVFHVMATEEILNEILSSFQQLDTHLSLGRHEDLLRIDEVKSIDLKELNLITGSPLKHSMYIPTSKIDEDETSSGIPYLLNWIYEIKHGIREWKKIPSLYFEKGYLINDDLINGEVYIDEDGYVVIFNV